MLQALFSEEWSNAPEEVVNFWLSAQWMCWFPRKCRDMWVKFMMHQNQTLEIDKAQSKTDIVRIVMLQWTWVSRNSPWEMKDCDWIEHMLKSRWQTIQPQFHMVGYGTETYHSSLFKEICQTCRCCKQLSISGLCATFCIREIHACLRSMSCVLRISVIRIRWQSTEI